jgi:hypothetical protein
MIINLKQVSNADADNIKLDKINYNFDQLVANGGGPQGPRGIKGELGPQGVTGKRGFQGDRGFQGTQGPSGDNNKVFWKNIQGDPTVPTTDTLVPIYNGPNNSPENTYPPIVSVGFLPGDVQYDSTPNFLNGNLPYQWIINRKNQFSSNLRFTSDDVPDHWVDFTMKLNSLNSVNEFTMEFKSQDANIENTSFILYAEDHIFKSNINGAILLKIGQNITEYNTDTIFNSKVTFNNVLVIEGTTEYPASADKVAVSADSEGTVIYKSVKELGGTVPFGTIISILPSIFSDNTKFINNEVIDTTHFPDLPIRIRAGSGVGKYKGWYLCNGQQWIGDTESHIVPDLNSFSYSIEDNSMSNDPNSQGYSFSTNTFVHLVGGADTTMVANEDQTYSNGIYNVNSAIGTNDNLISIVQGGTIYKIKRLPQIIYLDEVDLYWMSAGDGQAPISNTTFRLTDTNSSAGNISPNPQNIASTSNQQGSSYQISAIVNAPSGYYWSSVPVIGFPSYISDVVETLGNGVYPSVLNLAIYVSSQPEDQTIIPLSVDTSSILLPVPNINLILHRNSNPTNSTLTPVQDENIIYDSQTGYTFNIIVDAASGYRFYSVGDVDMSGSTVPPGSTFTVNSQSLSNSNKTLTKNITITVPVGTPTGSQFEYNAIGGPIEIPCVTASLDTTNFIGECLGNSTNASYSTLTLQLSAITNEDVDITIEISEAGCSTPSTDYVVLTIPAGSTSVQYSNLSSDYVDCGQGQCELQYREYIAITAINPPDYMICS